MYMNVKDEEKKKKDELSNHYCRIKKSRAKG